MNTPCHKVLFSLDWYTIDSGGAMFSTSGSYSLSGSIGQADAGMFANGSHTYHSDTAMTVEIRTQAKVRGWIEL